MIKFGSFVSHVPLFNLHWLSKKLTSSFTSWTNVIRFANHKHIPANTINVIPRDMKKLYKICSQCWSILVKELVRFLSSRCMENDEFAHRSELAIAFKRRTAVPHPYQGKGICTIDILYTLDSASNYSTIQKLKPWLQTQDIPMKWEDTYVFYFLNRELKH